MYGNVYLDIDLEELGVKRHGDDHFFEHEPIREAFEKTKFRFEGVHSHHHKQRIGVVDQDAGIVQVTVKLIIDPRTQTLDCIDELEGLPIKKMVIAAYISDPKMVIPCAIWSDGHFHRKIQRDPVQVDQHRKVIKIERDEISGIEDITSMVNDLLGILKGKIQPPEEEAWAI